MVGTLGYLEIKMKVARALSFDKRILTRLAEWRPDQPPYFASRAANR